MLIGPCALGEIMLYISDLFCLSFPLYCHEFVGFALISHFAPLLFITLHFFRLFQEVGCAFLYVLCFCPSPVDTFSCPTCMRVYNYSKVFMLLNKE